MIIVFNKIDQARITDVALLKKAYKEKCPTAHMIEMVAKERFNLDLLIKAVEELLPEGPEYYPVETITDNDKAVLVMKDIYKLYSDLYFCFKWTIF